MAKQSALDILAVIYNSCFNPSEVIRTKGICAVIETSVMKDWLRLLSITVEAHQAPESELGLQDLFISIIVWLTL